MLCLPTSTRRLFSFTLNCKLFVLSSNRFFFPFLCVCWRKKFFFSFFLLLHDKQQKECSPIFPSSFFENVVLILLLLLLFGSSRNWVFFSSQLTPTVITVFSHRKVACYLHKQSWVEQNFLFERQFFFLWRSIESKDLFINFKI